MKTVTQQDNERENEYIEEAKTTADIANAYQFSSYSPIEKRASKLLTLNIKNYFL